MSSAVQIVGIGMITPLGVDAPQTAASITAGLSAFEDSAIMDRAFQPFVTGSLPEDCLGPLSEDLTKDNYPTSRESRMLRLAHPALLEALAPLGEDLPQISLFLGIPETETTVPIQPDRFLNYLHIQCEQKFNRQTSQAIMTGRASGLKAVHQACGAIRSGSEKIVLAGGVDTFKDLYILATLDAEKRINSSLSMNGFIPGEGAAFLLLADQDYASTKGLEILATINGTSEGSEIGHMYSEEPYKGEGLATVVRNLLENVTTDTPVSVVYSSMNGENHFAKEWGVTFLRSSAKIREDYMIEHPADCIGDTGAAAGPIMVGLAAQRIKNGELHGPTLVYASSDTAARAACLLGGRN